MSAIVGKAGPPSISQPDFFEFSRPEDAEARLAAAGLRLQVHETVPLAVPLGTADGPFDLFANATVGMRMLIRSQPASVMEAIRDAMASAVEHDHRVDDGYDVPMPATIAVALQG